MDELSCEDKIRDEASMLSRRISRHLKVELNRNFIALTKTQIEHLMNIVRPLNELNIWLSFTACDDWNGIESLAREMSDLKLPSELDWSIKAFILGFYNLLPGNENQPLFVESDQKPFTGISKESTFRLGPLSVSIIRPANPTRFILSKDKP